MKKKENESENKKDLTSAEKQTADTADDTDVKIDISKSVFQINREMNAKHKRELDEQQARIDAEIEKREKEKREAYERKIREEKIELMRLKQGLIEESETIHEEPEKEVKLSFWKKISNFFYHNKWWFGFGVICASIGGFLIYNLLTKPNPDLIVLVVVDNSELGDMSDLDEYVVGFCDDFNNNGKTEVSIYYIPYSDNETRNYATGSDTKIATQFQSSDAVIVLGSKILDDTTPNAKEIFVDLESIYPDNPHVVDYKFMLKDTDLAKRIGIEPQYITDDLYLAVRVPKKLLYSSKKDMEETYEKDWPVFEKIVNDLS